MVNLNTPFRKTLSISVNSSSNINIHVKKRLFKVALTFLCTSLAKSVLKYKKVTLKNNDVVEYHGTKRRLRRLTIPSTLYLMIK